jgi:uncharacterized protein YvpB
MARMSVKRVMAWTSVTLAAALAACSGEGEPSNADQGPVAPNGIAQEGDAGGSTTPEEPARDAGPAGDAGKDAMPVDNTPPPASIQLDVPLVLQKPELDRGCEVTALTMVLKFAGINADKMKLAKEIDKVPYKTGGLFGNPNEAFVGDMYTFANPGYGVYHAPVERLAEKYLPGRVVKLTGQNFDDVVMKNVGKKRPVWIITNALFKKLAPGDFTTWNTAQGNVQITWQEHSVVITGYDANSIYINDPLGGKNKKLARTPFREAWEQMGKQAISYSP